MTTDRPQPEKLDPNPYASPAVASSTNADQSGFLDLTEAGAASAQAVVSDANNVVGVILFAWCLCAPLWLIMFPWYLYRLYCWHSLSAQFAELRHPNGFSKYGELAGKFKDSRPRLIAGAVAGFVAWALVAVGFLADLISQIMTPTAAP